MTLVDRRLLEQAKGVRGLLALDVVLGVVTAGLLVGQAWLIALLVSDAVAHDPAPRDLAVPLGLLLCVVAARAGAAWLTEVCAHRTSATVKQALRLAFLRRMVANGAWWLAGQRTGRLETVATRGLDGLDPYLARYLPAIVLAIVVPPLVVVAVAVQDPTAALIVAGTVPLIPVFMAVVGATTKARTQSRLVALQHLAGRFLDAMRGVTTLRIFGAPIRTGEVAAASDAFRRESTRTLRLAFVSSLVLELVGSLSVALVAVAVGLRLASGGLDLTAGLYVLVLAPEAYQPLRSLAAQFHASADGAAAADEVFAVLDRPPPDSRSGHEAPPMGGRLVVDSVTLRFPGTQQPVLHDLSFTLEPGEVVALVGPSGCGKSTVLSLVLRFREPDTGRIGFGGRDLAALDPDLWRTRVAWVPQRPYLFARSLRDNITLGRPCAAREEVLDAVAAADLRDVVRRLPDGLDSPLGERGHGLSVGERQRVALARAFLVDAPLLLLDEPTANLDGATEESVLASVRLLSAGRSVLVAAHRPALVALADRMVELPVGVAESIP